MDEGTMLVMNPHAALECERAAERRRRSRNLWHKTMNALLDRDSQIADVGRLLAKRFERSV